MRSEAEEMRRILRAVLPERAFLRRDRGDALFVSNAPALGFRESAVEGFELRIEGELMHILPNEGWMRRTEAAPPPSPLAESLARFRGEEIERGALLLFAQGLKLLDMGDSAPKNELLAFDRALRQRAALALRGGCGGGGLYALAILNHQIQMNQISKGE